MDVKNALLQGELDWEVYIEQLDNFQSKTYPNYICKLKKTLYGLKQASSAWYEKIRKFLEQSGYLVAPSNSGLFIKVKNEILTIILIYMDDLIITRDNKNKICQIRANISIQYQMKKLEELKHSFSLEIKRTKDEIFLCQ